MDESEHTQHGRYLGNPTQTALFIIGCVLIIFSFSSLIYIIYSIYHHDKKQKSNKIALRRQKSIKLKFKSVKSVNYPTISSATFYFLSTCSYITALFFFDDEDADNFGHDLHFVIAMVTFVAFIFAAKISIYAQFLARLYSSFKGSYLEPNKYIMKFCKCLLTLSALTISWWVILLSIRYLILKQQFNGYYMQFYFVFSFLFLFDFTVSWLVVCLFTKNLFASVLLKDRSVVIELGVGVDDDSKDDSSDSSLTRRDTMFDIAKNSIDCNDQKRLNLITKQVILSSVAIISSQLSYISLLIILIIKNTRGYSDNFQPKLYSLYAGAFYPMDVIINCIILYFNYKFADKYYKILCNCCHNKCHNCVQKHATNKIERQLIRDQGYAPIDDT